MLISTSHRKKQSKKIQKKKKISKLKAIKMGFLCNILNPKATLFFLALFSQVISPKTSLGLKLLYGVEMSIVTFLWFSFVSIFWTTNFVQKYLNKITFYTEKGMGLILTGLGLKILLSNN